MATDIIIHDEKDNVGVVVIDKIIGTITVVTLLHNYLVPLIETHT